MKLKGKVLLIAVVLCVISAIECDQIRIRLRNNRNNRLVNLNRSLKKRGVFHNHAGLLLAPQHKVYGFTKLAAPVAHAKFTLPHAHIPKFHHHHVEAPVQQVPHVDALPAVNVPQFHQHVDVPVVPEAHVHPVVETPLSAPILPPVQRIPSIPHVHETPLSAPILPPVQRIPIAPTVATVIPQQHHHASVYGTSGGFINGHPFILRPGNAVVQSYNVNYPRPVVHAVPQPPVQFAQTPVIASAAVPINHNYFVPRPVIQQAAPAIPVFPSPTPAAPVLPAAPVFPTARPFIPSPIAPQPPVFSVVPQHPFFFNQGLPEATPTVLSERPIVVQEPPQQPEQPSQFPELPQFPEQPQFPTGGADIPPQGGSDILPGQIPAQPSFPSFPSFPTQPSFPAQPPFQNVPQQPWTPSVFNPQPTAPQQPPVLPPVHGNVEPGFHGPSGYHYPNPNQIHKR